MFETYLIIPINIAIISFLLGWTYKIYVQPIKGDYENIIKKLDQKANLIKSQIIEHELNKEEFIQELIILWNFQNFRIKFEDEIIILKNSIEYKLFPAGVVSVIISCIYVLIIYEFILIDAATIVFLFYILTIFYLIVWIFEYKKIKYKINLFMEGTEITEIYSFKDLLR